MFVDLVKKACNKKFSEFLTSINYQYYPETL